MGKGKIGSGTWLFPEQHPKEFITEWTMKGVCENTKLKTGIINNVFENKDDQI